MAHVNPRLFCLQKLYNCTSEALCAVERKQNGDKKKQSREPAVTQEFSDDAYLDILRYVHKVQESQESNHRDKTKMLFLRISFLLSLMH